MSREELKEREWLARRFEERRARLRAVAYRMLGSVNKADDVLQEAWIRLGRSDASAIENMDGWLTTVVARICLDVLKARKSRLEEPLDGHEEALDVRVPDPIVSPLGQCDPEQEAILADSVGLALLVVLERLSPAERLAFVLHDMFSVPFDSIASIAGRSPEAARQLASRARRRVRGEARVPDVDLATQRRAVEAFMAAAREGDFEALVALLDPDVVLRADAGAPPDGMSRVVRGAGAVARQALSFSRLDLYTRPAVINGAAGAVTTRDGRPFSVAGFTVCRGGKIVEINILADPERLRGLDLALLDP
jgi:RNA polymerase sigma-70 factor (ECF subfamily)